MASSRPAKGKKRAEEEEEGGRGGESGAVGGAEKFTFFFRTDSPFSQWHPAEFEVEGVAYNCAEQFMMHQKAVLFGDDAMAATIMVTDSPRDQKALGRKVKNFDGKKWKENCRYIVKRGNIAKFSQNAGLKQKLMQTQGTAMVEASPTDTVWGIGLSAKNWRAKQRKHWRGQNLLGEILTEVREELAVQGPRKSEAQATEN